MIGSVGYLFLTDMKKEAGTTLENKARSIQTKIEERLQYRIETAKLLAKNSLMINALIDDEGKKEYLTPLANNFMENENVEYLNIVDFDGKVIFKTSKNTPEYNKSKYLRNALAMGQTVYYLDKRQHHLIVMAPIKYYNTTQGALISAFNMDKLINKYIVKVEHEYIKILDKKNILYSSNFKEDKTYYSYLLEPKEDSLFQKLGIKLEMGILESIYLSPIKNTIYKLLLLSLILLLAGIIISYFLTLSISDPILKLYERVKEDRYKKEHELLGSGDELEVLAKAFHEKTANLYKSKKLIQSVIDNIPDLIFFKDKDFKYIGCNKAFLKLAGKENTHQITGKEDFDLFDNETANFFRDKDIQMLHENKSRFNNEWVTFPNGEKIYYQVLKSPFNYDDSNIGVLGIGRDITELTKLQNEELEKQKIIYQQSKMASMGDMIGNIAHQWRQPLSVISTAATGLQLKKEYGILDDDFLDTTLTEIENNAQYLSKTIDTFRDFIKEEKMYKEVILQERISKALQIVETALKNNHIKLLNNIDKTPPLKIKLVIGELSQVIINLINNSKDAIKEHNIKEPWIKVDLEKLNNKALITIEDNGNGIPEKVLPKIFDPYFTTKQETKGTGLGLHMSYKIITESLNGKIYAKNTPKGVKFFIELPLGQPKEQA
jgi:PAS domain S-box-containing protein